jgi:uncharacterized repeat protein (TIGR01451 family)
LKNYFSYWLAALLMIASPSAYALTAAIVGKYSDSAATYEARRGETIQMQGQCRVATKWPSEAVDKTTWTVGDASTVYYGTTGLSHSFVADNHLGKTFIVKFKCFTTSGYRSDHEVSRSFKLIDPIPPTVKWDSANARFAKDRITIDAHVSDAGDGVDRVWILWPGAPSRNIEMRKESGDRYRYEIDTSRLPEGATDVQIWAASLSGASKGWETVGSFTVDRTPPRIGSSSLPAFAGDSLRILLSVRDPGSGVADVYVRSAGQFSSNAKRMETRNGREFEVLLDTSQQSEGVSGLEYLAEDKAGNSTGWTRFGSVTIDRTPPSVTWDSANPAYAKDRITLKAKIADAGSRVREARIWWPGAPSDGKQMNMKVGDTYGYEIDTSRLAEGVKEIQIRATDFAGNATGWLKVGSFNVDRTPPSIDWREPPDQALLHGDQIHVAGIVDDRHPDTVEIAWRAENETQWHSETRPVSDAAGKFSHDLPVPQQDVNYQLRLRAADEAGNLSAWSPVRTVVGQMAVRDLLQNAQLALKNNILSDRDNSGGLSPGDEFVYRLQVGADRSDAHGLSIRYALPAGLSMTQGLLPEFAADSAIVDNNRLNSRWNGGGDAQLLADGVDLPAHDSLTIDIPLTVAAAQTAGAIDSVISLQAKNATGALLVSHRLNLQRSYPADRALTLQLESMQPDRKYARGTEFDYRVTLHAPTWALNGVRLSYALPNGLQSAGDIHVTGDGAARFRRNPDWGKNGDQRLLWSAPGDPFAAGNSLTVTIPMRVTDAATFDAAIRSEVKAAAENISGEVTVEHFILVEEAFVDNRLRLKKTVDRRSALPGDTLRYTIMFTNASPDVLRELVITDFFQSEYLTLKSAHCGATMPDTLQCKTAEQRKPGTLEWRMDGTLPAGASGSVNYEAVLNR